MEMAGSYFCASLIQSNNYKAQVIYHTWTILAQVVLYLGIGIALWKTRVAPLTFAIAVLKFGRCMDLHWGNVTSYNFNEGFLFLNLVAWLIYTTYTWKFEDFKEWYLICILTQITLCSLYLSIF